MVEGPRCLVDDEGLKSEGYEQSKRLAEKRRCKLELQLRQAKAQLSRDLAELARMDADGLAVRLLDFMADRWSLKFENEEIRNELLFIDASEESDESDDE